MALISLLIPGVLCLFRTSAVDVRGSMVYFLHYTRALSKK